VIIELATGTWWLVRRVAWPGVRAVGVGLVVWHSGVEILPRRRRYARRVHAAGRALLTSTGVTALVYGIPTAASAAGVTVTAVVATAAVTRARARHRTAPVTRVAVRQGPVIRATIAPVEVQAA